jgi:hypothetical protein
MVLPMPLRVGIIDSGIGPTLGAAVAARVALRLAENGESLLARGDANDPLGHGTAVATLVMAHSPRSSLLSAQVFCAARPCTATVVADAIDWCVGEGARVINLSVGLREDRQVLRESCRAASEHGVVLVASSPARGGIVYPASHPGVIAVCGDARCAEGDCSSIARDRLFGASPLAPAGFAGGGASYAAARIAGRAAAFLEDHPAGTAADLRRHLLAICRFHGRECRQPVTSS